MAQQRLIQAIGRIELALSRLECVPASPDADRNIADLKTQHENLKYETMAAIRDLDAILAGGAS